jgi:hypothetical protein
MRIKVIKCWLPESVKSYAIETSDGTIIIFLNDGKGVINGKVQKEI